MILSICRNKCATIQAEASEHTKSSIIFTYLCTIFTLVKKNPDGSNPSGFGVSKLTSSTMGSAHSASSAAKRRARIQPQSP